MQERKMHKVIEYHGKKQTAVMVSIFKSKKQEKIFATMALERMSKDTRLKW